MPAPQRHPADQIDQCEQRQPQQYGREEKRLRCEDRSIVVLAFWSRPSARY
jgi:hypothetical protein